MKPNLEAASFQETNLLVERLRNAATLVEKLAGESEDRRRLRRAGAPKVESIFDSILGDTVENKTFMAVFSPALTVGAGMEMLQSSNSVAVAAAFRDMNRLDARMSRLSLEARGDGETARMAERQLLREEDLAQNRAVSLGNRAGRAGRARAARLSGKIDSMGAVAEDRIDERSIRTEVAISAARDLDETARQRAARISL